MKKIIFTAVLMISNLVLADTICQRSSTDMVELLSSPESRIGFRNQGGLANGGVCWWHARFQRAAAYLTEFRPELSAPTPDQLKKILNSLKMMNAVVEIPGFHDFLSFSNTYQKEIQLVLENWQREDGFVNQQWIRGLSGRSDLPPELMKTQMDNVYKAFQKSPRPMWVMAQIKGIVSHAYLVLDMAPTADGYEMQVIDSNQPTMTRTITYQVGQRSLVCGSFSFVPYPGFNSDFDLINAAVKKYCQNGPLF